MMKLLTAITKGRAYWKGENREELRCAALQPGDRPDWECRKLIACKNGAGQLAGNFRCERCKQEIEVQLIPAKQSITLPPRQ